MATYSPFGSSCFALSDNPLAICILQERQSALSGALEQTDAEVKRLGAEQAALLKAIRDADAARATTDKARFGIEDDINEHISNQTTHEKAARAMIKGAKRLSDVLHDLELQVRSTMKGGGQQEAPPNESRHPPAHHPPFYPTGRRYGE